jgi:hypothetical protein
MSETYVIGDVHGDYDCLVPLLRNARLVDGAMHWSAGDSVLVFMGDYFDRGPDGVSVVDLVIRIQDEAREAGGRVDALLGNHEPLILSALWMPDGFSDHPSGNFYGDWLANGGRESDLRRLTEEHIAWMLALPAMLRKGQWLFQHADSTSYLRYGSSVEEVNRAMSALLRRRDPVEYNRLFGEFRREFGDHRPEGHDKVSLMLDTYGTQRLVHGHTLISNMTRQRQEMVTEALVYDGGRCVNVDGGMGEGGQGFVYRLPSLGYT